MILTQVNYKVFKNTANCYKFIFFSTETETGRVNSLVTIIQKGVIDV